jgi:hypothetical protein
MDVCDSICIGGASVTEHLGQDRCASFASVFVFFENDNPSAFTQNESISLFIEWS